jgi:hypothetical protein
MSRFFISSSMPVFKLIASLTFVVASVLVPQASYAIEPFTTTNVPFWDISEVRAGALKQAIDNAPHEGGAALNLEVLGGRFAPNYESDILNFLLSPRPHLGTTIAFGKTDEFYLGLTWDVKLIQSFFFEGTFGGTLHDGPLDVRGEASYGCTANFRESAGLGYEVNQNWRVLGMIDHMSQAGICHPNRGLTNAGLRLGYLF